MGLRKMLAALLVLVACGVGLYFSNREKAAEAAKPSTSAAKIVSINDIDVTKISVKAKGGAETVLQKNGSGKWQMISPEYPADQQAVGTLVTAADNISQDKVVEDKMSDPKTYGFNDPALEVDVTSKNGKTTKLVIGDDVPANQGSYAMVEGDPKVYTVASYVKSGLNKTFNDLRDKRLLTFDQDKLSRVEFTAKKQTEEFGRDKDQWQIIKPKPLRADGSQVDDLIRKVMDLKMDTALSDEDSKKAAAGFASGTPVATAKFTDPSGTETIEIRKGKEDYYAKSSVVAGVYKIPADAGTAVDKGLDDFRQKKLFDFGFNDPSKIEMHDSGQAYSFSKSGDDWNSNGKKMDGISVQSLVDKLRDLAASKFIDTGTMPTSTMDIAVTWSDGKRVEKVVVAKQGDGYVAQRENEPALYGLDAKTVDELSKAASDVKPAPPPPAKKK
jgi:Domain of unknown function (DUF4340)